MKKVSKQERAIAFVFLRVQYVLVLEVIGAFRRHDGGLAIRVGTLKREKTAIEPLGFRGMLLSPARAVLVVCELGADHR